MIFPAFLKVKDMIENDSRCIRLFFRRLVASKFVIQSMGQEASEEALEKMYDEGFLKFSMEPGPNGQAFWRVMLYDQRLNAYSITDKIEFQLEEAK